MNTIAARPQLLTNREAADFLGVSQGTLDVWRCERRYTIPYHKIGSKVFYDTADLLAWLQSRKVHAGEKELANV
jgi:predicted DNA-binding transcriptional regulator AlpA